MSGKGEGRRKVHFLPWSFYVSRILCWFDFILFFVRWNPDFFCVFFSGLSNLPPPILNVWKLSEFIGTFIDPLSAYQGKEFRARIFFSTAFFGILFSETCFLDHFWCSSIPWWYCLSRKRLIAIESCFCFKIMLLKSCLLSENNYNSMSRKFPKNSKYR